VRSPPVLTNHLLKISFRCLSVGILCAFVVTSVLYRLAVLGSRLYFPILTVNMYKVQYKTTAVDILNCSVVLGPHNMFRARWGRVGGTGVTGAFAHAHCAVTKRCSFLNRHRLSYFIPLYCRYIDWCFLHTVCPGQVSFRRVPIILFRVVPPFVICCTLCSL